MVRSLMVAMVVGALLVFSVVMSIVWIVRHWTYVVELSMWTVFALAVAIAIGYLGRNLKESWAVLLAALVVFLVILLHGQGAASFHWQIGRLEAEFKKVAATAPNEIYYHENRPLLNYDGKLDDILDRRDALLRRYHYHMNGIWIVDTTGINIDATYYWSPFMGHDRPWRISGACLNLFTSDSDSINLNNFSFKCIIDTSQT